MLGSGLAIGAGTTLASHENPADQERFKFAHRPDSSVKNYPDGPGIYVNDDPTGQENSSVRVFGTPNASQHAPDTYYDREDDRDPIAADRQAPYLPQDIPKDTVTFNPALLRHTDNDPTGSSNDLTWIKGCADSDRNLKKHLRSWYEPSHEYLGPRTNETGADERGGEEIPGFHDGSIDLFDPATEADTLVVESTYTLLGDLPAGEPEPMCDGSEIPFPTEGTNYNTPSDSKCNAKTNTGHIQPGLDTMRRVSIQDISTDEVGGTSSDTRISDDMASFRMERTITNVEVCDTFQFFDRVYQYRGMGETPDGDNAMLWKTWYAGNTGIDSPKEHVLEGRDAPYFFDRSSAVYDEPKHKTPSNLRTSYLRMTSFPSGDNPDAPLPSIVVGKEIMSGDIFYVDGVRTDVPLVNVQENTGRFDQDSHELLSITFRSPLPKSDGVNGDWTSVPDNQIADLGREVQRDGLWQVSDWSTVTTQYLTQIDAGDPIPVDPPFNFENGYTLVDDTDVQLWTNGTDNDKPNFPWGEPVDSDDDGEPDNGQVRFESGHEFLTTPLPDKAQINADGECELDPGANQEGEAVRRAAEFCDWFNFFDVEQTGFEDQVEDRLNHTTPINPKTAWDSKTSLNVEPNFVWTEEWCDDRFSTNNEEILEVEDGDEDNASWTRDEINSHPCQYTALTLPDRPNPVSEVVAEFSNNKDFPSNAGPYRVLGGDYLVTTSLGLQDSSSSEDGWEPRFAFAFDPQDNAGTGNLNSLNDRDIYTDGLDRVRLYGETGEAPPEIYENPEDIYDSDAIPKDSATFNPAIIQHTDDDFTGFSNSFSWIQGCDGDANLKKHLRTWYEPGHDYVGPDRDTTSETPEPTQADVIQVESTYNLVEGSTYEPTTMCGGDTLIPFSTEGTNFAKLGDQDDDGTVEESEDAVCNENDAPSVEFSNSGNGQPGLDQMRPVKVSDVGAKDGETTPTTNGTVELERSVTLSKCANIQLFDMLVQFRGVNSNATGESSQATFDTWYVGNTRADHHVEQISVMGDRVYIGPSQTGTEADSRPSQTQSVYLEMDFFNQDVARFTIGKEIHAGDTFYVDGVRHDVSAIHVVDDGSGDDDIGPELRSLTLRTPLPKGDPVPLSGVNDASEQPCSEWNTQPVHQSHRHEFLDEQCQTSEQSHVSSQWLVNFCERCPLAVDPPFNGRTNLDPTVVDAYRQIDDTDVQLWTPDPDHPDVDTFPWGPSNPSVPDGDGQSKFPLGHTYLTRERPQCEPIEETDPAQAFPATEADAKFCAWIDFWDAQPTKFKQLRERVGAKTEAPVNAFDSWDADGLPATVGHFNYDVEWCEDRYNTGLDEILLATGSSESWERQPVDSEPCPYTVFSLPDRSNPASATSGELDTKKNGLPSGGSTFDLLGGDYLISTSLQLEEEGGPVSNTQAVFNPYDGDENCDLETVPELTNAIRDWVNGDIVATFEDAGQGDRIGSGSFADLNAIVIVANDWLDSPGYC